MNHSNLIKNIKINFSMARALLFFIVLFLSYLLAVETKPRSLGDFNLIVLVSSLGILGYNIFNAIIREVNEGTWSYVVTSKLSPVEMLMGQVLGSAPVALVVAAVAFCIHVIGFEFRMAILFSGYGLLIVSLFACVGTWCAINWENQISAGRSTFRIENQLSALSLAAVFLFGMFLYGVLHRKTQTIHWYGAQYKDYKLLISAFLFFSALCVGGQIRNLQQAMKIRVSCLYWFISAWFIIFFFLGFTFIDENWLLSLLSDVSRAPKSLLEGRLNEIMSYFTYLRLHFVYMAWLTFLFISLVVNPLSPATLRNLADKVKSRKWKDFLKMMPASFVNFATLICAFVALAIGYFALPKIDMLNDFLDSFFAGTCVVTLVLFRDSLVLWIFSHVFQRRHKILFCTYLIGVWLIFPALMAATFGKSSLAIRFFWPYSGSWPFFDTSSILIVLLEVVAAFIVFLILQRRVRPAD